MEILKKIVKKSIFCVFIIFFCYWIFFLISYFLGWFQVSIFLKDIYFLPKTAYHFYVEGNIFAKEYFDTKNDNLKKMSILSYDKSLKKFFIPAAANNKKYLENLNIGNQTSFENTFAVGDGAGQDGGEFLPVDYRPKKFNEKSLNLYKKKILHESESLNLYEIY